MPLDTSTYALALLRLDGRRWNELRRTTAQVSTQASADGSSYLEQGNTKIICTVHGPSEGRSSGGGSSRDNAASLDVEITFAGFSGLERKRRGRGDKRTAEMCHALREAYNSILHLQHYPNSSIAINLHVLSQDGSLLAACINAATLALVDAGVPMSDYLVGVTVGSSPTSSASDADPSAVEMTDPLLDLNSLEEQELPFLTVGTRGRAGESGEGEKVDLLVMESRIRMERLEGMIAVSLDGCKRVREVLDQVVRAHGAGMVVSG